MNDFKPFIRHLADESAKVIRPHFGNPDLTVDSKADASPVTIADRKAEEVLRGIINRECPGHGIIGEEFGNENTDAEYVWVLDPIDGTISFTTGCPLFGTLIGLLHNGQPLLGVIHQPILGQLCLGDNDSCVLGDRPVKIRDTARLEDATLLTTDPRNVAKYQPHSDWTALANRAKHYRTWGDCYGYLLVASGFADVMADPIMNPWDLLPLIPVIRGAGGVITGWDGGDPVNAESAIAGSPKLHAEVVKALG